MTAAFLLDTDVLSEQTRAAPDPRLVAWLERHADDGFAIAAVTFSEVRYGIERHPHGRRRAALEQWWHTTVLLLPVLAYGYDAALWHARDSVRVWRPRERLDRSLMARSPQRLP